MANPDVVCIGNSFAEHMVFGVPSIPSFGGAVAGSDFEVYAGGMALNVATALTKLGHSAAILTKIGTDQCGQFVKGKIEKKLNSFAATTLVVGKDIYTPRLVTLVDNTADRDRTFIGVQRPSSDIGLSDLHKAMPVLEKCRAVYFGDVGNIPAVEDNRIEAFIRDLREANKGVLVVSDAVAKPKLAEARFQRAIIPFLKSLDFFMPSDVEAMMLANIPVIKPPQAAEGSVDLDVDEEKKYLNACERAITELHGVYQVKNLCLKIADRGVILSLQNNGTASEHRIRSSFVSDVVDRTGGGDAWCAGFLAALLNKERVLRACDFGNAAASVCIRHAGPNSFSIDMKTLRDIVPHEKR